jgi:hypothetical protein
MSQYVFRSSAGDFAIILKNERWHVIYQGESLGNYASPALAAADVSGGHTSSTSNGIDPGTLGIPEDLCEWDVKNS